MTTQPKVNGAPVRRPATRDDLFVGNTVYKGAGRTAYRIWAVDSPRPGVRTASVVKTTTVKDPARGAFYPAEVFTVECTPKPQTLRDFRERVAALAEQARQMPVSSARFTDTELLARLHEELALTKGYVALYNDALTVADPEDVEWSALWDARVLHQDRARNQAEDIASTSARIAAAAERTAGGAR